MQLGLSYLFVANDLSVVRYLADRVAVMYLGRFVEIGEINEVFDRPAHPYTQGLLASIPRGVLGTGRRLRAIDGMVPSLGQVSPGCAFEPRCPVRMERCRSQLPAVSTVSGPGETPHAVHCHLFEACGT